MTTASDIYTLNFPNAKNIVVSGDIHGEFNQLVHKLCVQYAMRDTLLIVAGDCGFGFDNPGYYDEMVKKNSRRMSEANNRIVFVRGNHDNPAYFDGETFRHRRFIAVPDYSIIRACGHTILCVGGAISIDRLYRMQKWEADNKAKQKHTHSHSTDSPLSRQYYWPNEAPVYNDALLTRINERFAIDTVVTHTAPTFCQLLNKCGTICTFMASDDTLSKDIEDERATMTELYDRLIHDAHPLTHWYYGHFHQSWHDSIEGVLFSMLEIMEFREVY